MTLTDEFIEERFEQWSKKKGFKGKPFEGWLEEGFKEGFREGFEEGRIEESIKVLSELSASRDKIIKSLTERFNITEEQAEVYYNQYREY